MLDQTNFPGSHPSPLPPRSGREAHIAEDGVAGLLLGPGAARLLGRTFKMSVAGPAPAAVANADQPMHTGDRNVALPRREVLGKVLRGAPDELAPALSHRRGVREQPSWRPMAPRCAGTASGDSQRGRITAATRGRPGGCPGGLFDLAVDPVLNIERATVARLQAPEQSAPDGGDHRQKLRSKRT